jgi:hypothetical protein
MNGSKMLRAAGISLLALCMLAGIQPMAKADDWNQKTIFTFSGPVEIPGKVLDAGTYVFKLADVTSDRNVVQVFNRRGNKLYGTFLTIPDYRLKPTGKTVITFDERAAGSPEAVKAWFYPGDSYGHQFVYPKAKAIELAKANNAPVPSIPDEVAATRTAIEKAPLKAQQPSGEEVEIAEAFEVPPATEQLPARLPKTASTLPLIGLIGLLSLAISASLRFAGVKTK